MTCFRSALLCGFVLLIAGAAGCATSTHEIRIPRLSNIQIDGIGGDWSDSGYRVEVFSDTAGVQQPATEGSARMRLGWDPRGLLVLLDVRDDRAVESDDPRDLGAGDSVEFYLYTEREGLLHWHAIVSPGIDPRHDELRKEIAPAEMRLFPAMQRVCPDLEIARTRVSDGYVLEALLPWSNLGITPGEGATLALQVILNDVDGVGKLHRLRWFPLIGMSMSGISTPYDSRMKRASRRR
jgi:hypothetical protein